GPGTEGSGGVLSHEWADSDTIIGAAQEALTRRESTLKEEKKDPAIVVEDEKHEPPVRLFKVTVKDKKVTRLSDNTDRIAMLAVSPDGKRAVTTHESSLSYVFDNKIKPKTFLYDLATGE